MRKKKPLVIIEFLNADTHTYTHLHCVFKSKFKWYCRMRNLYIALNELPPIENNVLMMMMMRAPTMYNTSQILDSSFFFFLFFFFFASFEMNNTNRVNNNEHRTEYGNNVHNDVNSVLKTLYQNAQVVKRCMTAMFYKCRRKLISVCFVCVCMYMDVYVFK